MTIKTKLTTGVIDVLTTDTVLFTVAASTRIAISAFSCFSSAAATVSYYLSPDDTSTNGELIQKLTFAPDETLDLGSLMGQGVDQGMRVIAVADVVGTNATISYALYDGDDY